MKSRYITALAMAVGLACSVNTNAATYNLTLGTQNTYTVGVGNFSDTFNFSLSGLSNLSTHLNNLINVNSHNIKIELFDGANASLGFAQGASSSSLGFNSLDAGNYHLQVTGQGIHGPNVTHSYTLGTSVSPAPEPETWAMMGLGLAVITRVSRRKNSNTSVPALV